ncbi:Exodeoxyribonuclease V alpha chain [Hyphomicrobiales bacterium]|nr:Exodeoxyribonuclease V alpha chain [Hyphomicrobiales bacterium]
MPFTSALGTSEIARELDRFEQRLGYSMNREQRAAVAAAVRMPLSLLTGGAGTGKTTALRAVHDICERQLSSVYQIALAGRAAQRMKETTGRPAMTIAGFINRIADGTIELDALSGALVIIDEASMLDLPLFYRLLKKLPPDTRLMLVGDPGQIPPIGFGLVLHVLAEPESPIPKTHLLRYIVKLTPLAFPPWHDPFALANCQRSLVMPVPTPESALSNALTRNPRPLSSATSRAGSDRYPDHQRIADGKRGGRWHQQFVPQLRRRPWPRAGAVFGRRACHLGT